MAAAIAGTLVLAAIVLMMATLVDPHGSRRQWQWLIDVDGHDEQLVHGGSGNSWLMLTATMNNWFMAAVATVG
jgi:hypothetical protein